MSKNTQNPLQMATQALAASADANLSRQLQLDSEDYT